MLNMSRLLKQTAVYWSPGTNDGRGSFTYSTGVEISCRITVKKDKIYSDRESKDRVYSEVLTSTEIAEGGRIYEGNLSDLTDPTDPLESGITSYNIMTVEIHKSIDSQQTLYRAMLENA